jgi:hypothetical protein
MSSAGQATSSSTSNSLLIIDALADYTKITGIDLSKNSFAAELELSNSPQGILQSLQERMKAFNIDRDRNQRLIDYLSSTVSVLQSFSGILGDVVGGLVSDGHLLSYGSFNLTSSGPRPTSKRFVCWDRRSPCCTSFEYALQPLPVMNEYVRPPVGFRQTTIPF